MTHPCDEQRTLLIAYLQEELAPLERTRLETHLGHCRRCGVLKKEIEHSFDVARAWVPRVEEEHLDRLVTRLSPYIAEAENARRSRPSMLVFAFAGTIAVAAVLLFFVLLPRMIAPVQEDKPTIAKTTPEPTSAPHVNPQEESLAANVTPLVAVQPTRHIKLVASAAWDGRVEALDARRSEIRMTRGFAVIEFEGGQGRALTVHAPGVDVEVVGTRFFVDVSPDGRSSIVGVKKGRVRAVTKMRQDEIAAGDSRAYAPNGELSTDHYSPRAIAYLEDGALARTEEVENAQKPARTSRHRSRIPRLPEASGAAAAILMRAEDLAQNGEIDAALALYQRLANTGDPKLVPYRGFAQYEEARILAFDKHQRSRAEAILQELAAGGGGDVATEAAFALCELDLTYAPCRAAACLRDLSATKTKAAAAEARSLLERWGLEKIDCDR